MREPGFICCLWDLSVVFGIYLLSLGFICCLWDLSVVFGIYLFVPDLG